MTKPGEMGTVIGRTARLHGQLHCDNDLQIDGDFEGTIRQTGGRLTIGPEARIHANISAAEVVVYGNVEGDIRATGRVDLRSSAIVLGDIFAVRISMEENAMLRGQVDPSRAGEEEPVPQGIAKSSPSGIMVMPLDMQEIEQPILVHPPEHVTVVERSVAPAVLTQSGRQLPMALAAFAAGARQDLGFDSRAYRKESLQTDEDTLWRNHSSEE